MATQLPSPKRGTAHNFGPCLLWPNGWIDQDATWYGGRPRPRPHCVRWGPSSLPKKGQSPNFRPMSIVAKRLDGSRCHLVGRPRPWPHCVRWGPSPSPIGAYSPKFFGPCLLWPNGWMNQNAIWYGGRLRPKRYCVRWGPNSPKGHSPQFSAHVCCGQTDGWIKMPLGTEVGLGPGHIVLDGDPAPS